jgi:cellulose synthase/poly-beta-1,6-N-acetylglucosamine synthase-like glycosyltransferase
MQNYSLLDYFFLGAMAATWLMLLYQVILSYAGYQAFTASYAEEPGEGVAYADLPKVSILVPAHNEAIVIARTVDALMQLDYPQDRLEVVIINDSSTDRTGEILVQKLKQYPQLKILTIQPSVGGKGKARALNNGLEIATGEFIAVYDADNIPERRALISLMRSILAAPNLGAVVGKFRTHNHDSNLLTRFINIETLSFQGLVQAGRCRLFGMTTISGTNFVVRRDLLDQIGGWNPEALTEDTELTVRIYNEGYQIKYVPESVTWEEEPEKIKVWIKQRTRWVQGNLWVIGHGIINLHRMQSKVIIWDIIYLFCIYLIFFTSVLISDVIFIIGLLGLKTVAIKGPLLLIWFLAYALFIVETFISLSFERGEGNLKNLLLISIMYFTYCQLWLFVVIRSCWLLFKRYLTGAAFHWDKTERVAR